MALKIIWLLNENILKYKHPNGFVDLNVASNGKLKTIFDPSWTLLCAICVVPSSRPFNKF